MMDKTITIEEAHGIAKRFIDGHFNNPGEKPRIRIPADPDHDDDLRLRAFIDQHAALLADAERLRGAISRMIEHKCTLGFNAWHRQIQGIGYEALQPLAPPPSPAPRQATGEEAADV